MAGIIFLVFAGVALYLVIKSHRSYRDTLLDSSDQFELRSLQHVGTDGETDVGEKGKNSPFWRSKHSKQQTSEIAEESRYRQFFPQNKCDRCSAESNYTAYRDGLFLTFCSHHTRAHRDKLSVSGFLLVPSSAAELARQ